MKAIGQGKHWEWKPVTKIEVGDQLHRWGDWLVVTDISIAGELASITYIDGKEKKTTKYRTSDELMVRLI